VNPGCTNREKIVRSMNVTGMKRVPVDVLHILHAIRHMENVMIRVIPEIQPPNVA
jgi:hypothetical protein